MLHVARSVVKVKGVTKRAAWLLVGGSNTISSVASGHRGFRATHVLSGSLDLLTLFLNTLPPQSQTGR